MSQLKSIRLVKQSNDPAQPCQFELVGTDGGPVPLELRWEDLPTVASWLGFGEIELLRDRLNNSEVFEGGVVLDLDGVDGVDLG